MKNVDARTYKPTSDRQTKVTLQRSHLYLAMGVVLVTGIVGVVGLGVAALPGLGFITVSTAMGTAAIAITFLVAVSLVSLTTMRRIGRNDPKSSATETTSMVSPKETLPSSELVTRVDTASADLEDASPVGHANRQSDAERRRVRVVPRRRPGPEPFEGGQIHPVRDVEGIGERYGRLLDRLGITDTKQLRNADPARIADALKVTPAHVQGWQSRAELMSVDGIGGEYADLLFHAGVPSVRSLCAKTPQDLLDRIIRLERRQGRRVQGNTIGIKAVQGWIQAAKAQRPGHGPHSVDRANIRSR